MKKIISIVLLLIVLAVGGLILGPSFINWDKYKPEIISQLQAATGHEYAIAGKIELAIVPMPRLKLEQLSVGMPAALGGGTIVSLDKAAVNVELAPLLQKQIVVKSVELVKPVFNLGVRADGTAIWMTPELQKKMDAGKAVSTQAQNATGNAVDMGRAFGNAISLNEIKITEGSFSYSDARKGTKTALDKINLDIQAGSLFGPYTIEGNVDYNGQPVTLTVKSTKVADLNAAIPLQAEFHLASGGTVASYSGIVATKPALELQGETGLKTNNLSEALKAITGTANPALAKSVNVTGILTYNDVGVDYKNMVLNFAGTEVAGSIVARNLKKEAGKPLDVTVSLKAEKPAQLDALMPPKAADAKKSGFLPENIALPMDMRLKADVTAKSAVFKGATFSDITLSAVLSDKDISGAVKAVTPGQGKIDSTYKLAAGSLSRNDKGGVLLSDLSLTLEGSAQASVPQALAKPFLPADALKSVGNLLTTPASAAYKLNIDPDLVKIENANISMLDTDMALSGSFKPKKAGGRDMLTLVASAASLDGDEWMTRLQPPKQEATAPATTTEKKKVDVAGMAKKLTLPMDLDASVSVGSLKYGGETYDKVLFKGKLISNKLTIESAGLAAEGGNSLTIAGTIGDVSALKDVDLTIQGKTPDTEKTLQAFKVDTKNMPKSIGASEVLAELKGQPDNLSFVANAKALKGTVEASGVLDDLMTDAPKVSNLTIRVKHPNYVELARIFSPNFKSSVAMDKNLDVYTSMTRQGSVYALKDFQATIGPSTITGQVSFDSSGVRPKLTAAISAGDLALSDILGYEKKSKGTVQAVTPTNSENVRWSRNAINVDWMRKYDADVKITAKSLTWVNWRMDNAVLETKLDNGVMTVSRLNGGLYGGNINANATVTAPADTRAPLAVTATTKLTDVSLESFVSSFSGSQLVKARGSINLDASVESAGVSPAALIFGLKGKGTSTGKDIVFEGFDLARVSRTLVQPSSSMTENITSLLDTSMTGGQTAFETLDGSFTISEGVINFDKLLLTGTAATVNTLGKVNLPLWTVDLENSIKLVEPADAPPLKTSFRGPLDNPGKTFGRSALDSYVGNRLQSIIGETIQDKLQDKGILDKVPGAATPQSAGDVIQNLIQQKTAPKGSTVTTPTTPSGSTITPSTPLSPAAQQGAPVAPAAPAPAPAPAAVEVAPVAPAPVAPAPEAAAPVVVPQAAPAAVETAPAPAQAAPQVAPVEAAPVAPAATEATPAPAASPDAPATPTTPAADDPIGNLIEGLTDQ